MKPASKCRLLSKMDPPRGPTGLGQRNCSGRSHERISQPNCGARALQMSNFPEMVFIYRSVTELSSHLFSNYPFASFCESERSVSKYICHIILVNERCPSWDLMCIEANWNKHDWWGFMVTCAQFLRLPWWQWPEFGPCLCSMTVLASQPSALHAACILFPCGFFEQHRDDSIQPLCLTAQGRKDHVPYVYWGLRKAVSFEAIKPKLWEFAVVIGQACIAQSISGWVVTAQDSGFNTKNSLCCFRNESPIWL